MPVRTAIHGSEDTLSLRLLVLDGFHPLHYQMVMIWYTSGLII